MSTSEPLKPETILSQLISMFETFTPDEDYLEEDENTFDDVKFIETMIQSDEDSIETKIATILRFVEDWFPDELDDEETADFVETIEQAKNFLRQPTPELKDRSPKKLPLFARFDGHIFCDVELFKQDEQEAVRRAIAAGDYEVTNTGYVPDVSYYTDDTILAPDGEIDF